MKEPTDQEIKKYFENVYLDLSYSASCIATVRHFLALAKQETKMEGVLSEKEWISNFLDGKYVTATGGVADQYMMALIAARRGLTPAANAIQVPPEAEWPKDSLAVQVMYSYKIPEANENRIRCPNLLIKEIRRSKPAWDYKVDDVVFAFYNSIPIVTKITYIGTEDVKISVNGNDDRVVSKGNIKPFDATKIGKPWSEI